MLFFSSVCLINEVEKEKRNFYPVSLSRCKAVSQNIALHLMLVVGCVVVVMESLHTPKT
jgi:hypothetical protein